MKTTLNAIRVHISCEDGWLKLLAHLDKTGPDDEPLSILTILDSNGLDDAILCLRAVAGRDREIRLYAVWCARQVQHLMTDPRSIAALDVAERFANGLATDAELATAWRAADAAEGDARVAAWDAQETAAGAALAVVRAAAGAAAGAAGAAVDIAGDVARAAARAAAGGAAGAAGDVGDARYAAGDVARLVAEEAQEAELRRVLVANMEE